jgi:pheromone shutdown-related protein TraB
MTFSDNVSILEKENKTYYIIGTAHISADSVKEVEDVIEMVKPDTVAIELCQARFDAKMDEDRWKKLDIFEIIKQKKFLFLLSSLAMGAFQRRIGEKLGVQPGAEFFAAIEKAKEVGADLVLADRDVQATLKRTWANLGFFKKLNAMSMLVGSLFSGDDIEITKEQIEKMKEKDQLADMMNEFAIENPEIKKPLIDERDEYLMSSIEEAKGEKIVAIVGAGHVPGMITHFGKIIDKEKLCELPKASLLPKIAKWIIPFAVIGLIFQGYMNQGFDTLETMIYAWVIPNSLLAGIFTIAAGAKLPSIITAIIGSPITSLNPLVPLPIFVGYVEAKFRKPTVQDCEKINDDCKDFKGFYKNQFTRVLLVAVASVLGSGLGGMIGISWLIWIS